MVSAQRFINNIAILTDSSSDLGAELAEENGILLLPLQVTANDKTYRDAVDITCSEVIEHVIAHNPVSTSMPLPGDVLDALQALQDHGIHKAVFVLISSALSGTVDMVRMVTRDMPEMQIEVVDTRYTSMLLGYMALEAASHRSTLAIGEYTQHLAKARDGIFGEFVLPSLDHLIRGGRIGLVTAVVGKLLVLKPIIGINQEGRMHTLANALGLKRAYAQMIEMVREFAAEKRFEATVLYANSREACDKMAETLRNLPGQIRVTVRQLGPSMIVHAGPEIMCICMRLLPNGA